MHAYDYYLHCFSIGRMLMIIIINYYRATDREGKENTHSKNLVSWISVKKLKAIMVNDAIW